MENLRSDLILLCSRLHIVKANLLQQIEHDKEIVLKLKQNSTIALNDLKSGNVLTDERAAENLRNSIEDLLKVSSMTTLFVLPGGSLGLIALRKLLQTDIAAKAHIEKLLTLSVEEQIH